MASETSATAPAQQTVWLCGEFMPIEQARVPVLDRGFIFGDGIYEVVPVYGRRPFRLDHHLARLERSLGRISIANPFDRDGWTRLVDELIARHPWDDQFVYMQITRGVAKRDHAFPKGIAPTVFAMSSELPPLSPALLEHGVATISLPDERWLNCDIKSTSLLGNVLARQAAVDAGAAECLMFRDGFLTEGSASNIWLVRNGRVSGPPHDRLVLEGIRYGLMAELCERIGIEFELRRIVRDEVLAADELLLSSATKEVLPITSLDGRAVGSGRPGPIWKRLYAAYQQAKRDSGADALATAFARLEQLLEFPADFPLKVMGRRVDDFAQQIVGVVHRHVPGFDPATVELRPSRQGNWLSVTLPLRIDSREQIEALYRELAIHPLVRVVL